jgi:hypothetical protein
MSRLDVLKLFGLIALVIFGAAVAYSSTMGLNELFYSLSRGHQLSESTLGWFTLGIVLGVWLGPVTVYELGTSRYWSDEAYFAWSGSTLILALAILGAISIVMGHLFRASPILLVASLIFGFVCTALIHYLGRWAGSRSKNNSSRPSPSRSKSSTVTLVRPIRVAPAVWASVAGVGTFCGILASVFTSNIALQLILAVTAAAAAGIVAYVSLRR